MNYHNITKDDMLNGDGLRVVLWVAGCNHNCVGCHNPETHCPNSGILFDEEVEKELFEYVKKPYISGMTFSGGDPLYPENREIVTELAKKIKQLIPVKTIWLYTGYLYEQVKDLEIMNYIDVLVDGEFMIDLKDENLKWVGSSNQRVIDIPSTLKQNQIVLH